MSFRWCRIVSVTALDPFSVACLWHIACRHNEGMDSSHCVWTWLDRVEIDRPTISHFTTQLRHECKIATSNTWSPLPSPRDCIVTETYCFPSVDSKKFYTCITAIPWISDSDGWLRLGEPQLPGEQVTDVDSKWSVYFPILRWLFSWTMTSKSLYDYAALGILDSRQSFHLTSRKSRSLSAHLSINIADKLEFLTTMSEVTYSRTSNRYYGLI